MPVVLLSGPTGDVLSLGFGANMVAKLELKGTAEHSVPYFLAYSCVLSRNGIAPYRELTLLAHRDNVKSVVERHD